MEAAVKAGYWNLFSFNPLLKKEGKNPFPISSKPGDGSYQAFLANETRYSSLARKFPDRAQDLFAKSEAAANLAATGTIYPASIRSRVFGSQHDFMVNWKRRDTQRRI